MQKNILSFPDGNLAYQEYGNGPELWIALHGFAQAGAVFAAVHAQLPSRVTLVALDLPWHGQSQWDADVFLLPNIQATIESILFSKGVQKYTMLGFSFGARLALALTALEASRWSKLVLLAPDGLPRRGWYAFVDRMPGWGKKILSKAFNQAPYLLKIAEKMYHWKWLDAFSLKFMRQHLQHEDQIRRLKGTWLSAALFPKLEHSCKRLTELNLPVFLITGEEDKVIPPDSFGYLAQKIPEAQWLRLKEVGHELLSASVVPQWAPALLQNMNSNAHKGI